ncbi:MAG: hypothetical protein GY841_15455 [FCB group bacterium]|nr:hypothetical protein [FCB group bacterium]
MSATDWAELDDSLAGVHASETNGLGVPNGGGSQIFAFNSFDANQIGAAGRRCTIDDFVPMASGGRISGCVARLPSGANTGFSPLLFMSLSGTSVNDNAYILGLEDADPYRIVLLKGSPNDGIPDGTYLARSSTQYNMSDNLWHHIRLDVIHQGSGAVTLEAFHSDLIANPCTAPVWTAIDGLAQFVDDAVGANTGTVPLIGGYTGFACAYMQSIATRGGFDHIRIERQVP